MSLDERALRRPEWAEGEWLTFADGSRLSIVRPVIRAVRYLPVSREDGTHQYGRRKFVMDDQSYADLLDTMFTVDSGTAEADALLTLTVYLLRKNYDLSDEQLGDLLPRVMIDADTPDPENAEMWAAIAAVVTGRSGPKATSAGSGS